LEAIGGYFVGGHWWLFYWRPLVVVDGYFINGY